MVLQKNIYIVFFSQIERYDWLKYERRGVTAT